MSTSEEPSQQGSNLFLPSDQMEGFLLLFAMRSLGGTPVKKAQEEDSTKPGSPGSSDSQAMGQVWFAFLSPEASVPCPLIL